MSFDLSKKNPDIKSIAKKVIKDKKLLTELKETLLSKKETLRFNSFNVLLLISEKHPEVLYPEWDFFVKLLESDNAYHKYIAIYIIANLTRFDTKNKFEKTFNKYYNLLDDKSIIPPSHVAFNSGKIVKAKPKLQNKITNKLLNIDRIHHKAERKDLIKSYVIEAFDLYFEEAKDKKKIIEFVRK